MEQKLRSRVYTSVATFSSELGAVFRSVAGVDLGGNTIEPQNNPTENATCDDILTANQREGKKLAKRILRAIQQPLQEARYKEAELSGKPFETQLRGWDTSSQNKGNVPVNLLSSHEDDGSESKTGEETAIWEAPTFSDVDTSNVPRGVYGLRGTGNTPSPSGDAICRMAEGRAYSEAEIPVKDSSVASFPNPTATDHFATKNDEIPDQRIMDGAMLQLYNEMLRGNTRTSPMKPADPLTPPHSEKALLAATVHGGIPWYLEPFDPVGTTVHEERWTGREVMRAMTEELSEIDEAEMKGLQNAMDESAEGIGAGPEGISPVKKATAKKRKKSRLW